MKKILSLLLALTLVFALSACGKNDTSSDIDTSVSSIQTENESNTAGEDTSSTTTEIDNNSATNSTVKEESKPSSTENSKPVESSKPTNSTSTSSNSKLTETSKPTTSTTPSTPSTPTKPTLPFSDLFYGGNALALTDKNTNGITANRILNRSSYEIFHAYIFDNLSSIETKDWKYQLGDTTHNLKQYAVPESVVYQYAAQFFNIDTTTKNILKTSDRYDSSKGIYWIYANDPWFSNGDDAEIKGYENLGNDEYIVYAQAKEVNHLWPCSNCATTNSCVISQPCFKAKIKATGKSSYIVLSFEYIDSIPSK